MIRETLKLMGLRESPNIRNILDSITTYNDQKGIAIATKLQASTELKMKGATGFKVYRKIPKRPPMPWIFLR